MTASLCLGQGAIVASIRLKQKTTGLKLVQADNGTRPENGFSIVGAPPQYQITSIVLQDLNCRCEKRHSHRPTSIRC